MKPLGYKQALKNIAPISNLHLDSLEITQECSNVDIIKGTW